MHQHNKLIWFAAILLIASLGLGAQATWAAPTVGSVTTVYAFDPTKNEFVEGLAIDKAGNIYVGLYVTGEIWKFAPDGTPSILATLDVGTQGGGLVGLALDDEGNLYACMASYVEGTHGVWKINPNGKTRLFAALDPFAQPVSNPYSPYPPFGSPPAAYGFPNALAFDDDGNLYVSDSFLSLVWKITKSGKTTVWIQDPLLNYLSAYGANGVEFDRNSLFIANTDQASIVRVKKSEDGHPGKAEVFVQDSSLQGADGIAFDVHHNLYVANDTINTLARVSPRGTLTTLATSTAGLDYPASTSFGQSHGQRRILYFTNYGGNFNTPSLQKIDVGVKGTPLPEANQEEDRGED